jgi:hypothetical protein
VGGAEPPRLGGGQDPHLGQVGLAHHHEPGVAQAPHAECLVAWDEVGEQVAAHGDRHPRHRPVVLDGDGDAGKRSGIAGADLCRRGQRRLVGDVGEGVELGLELVYAPQRELDQLGGADLARADQGGEFDR